MAHSTTRALVLRTAGTNCDAETVHALETSGAKAELLHLSEILRDPKKLAQFSILVVPGGFSYGDDIAAGRILANELKTKLREELSRFVEEDKLVIGVCNGFQVLVKAGLLPGEGEEFEQTATLTQNDSGRFQCHWVSLKTENSKAKWLRNLPRQFELPIAHGEGKFVAKDSEALRRIEKAGQVVFRYHPDNPNGSMKNIAGVCNEKGNVLGLMPHPERFVSIFQHPAWTRGETKKKHEGDAPGLVFWKSAVKHASDL